MVLFVQPLADFDVDGNPITDPSLRSNQTYLVDVGFGSGNLTYPIPLVEVEEKSLGWPGASKFERHRLRRGDGGGENTKTSLALGERVVFLFSALVEKKWTKGVPMHPACVL